MTDQYDSFILGTNQWVESVYTENILTCQGWDINDYSPIASISFSHVF